VARLIWAGYSRLTVTGPLAQVSNPVFFILSAGVREQQQGN